MSRYTSPVIYEIQPNRCPRCRREATHTRTAGLGISGEVAICTKNHTWPVRNRRWYTIQDDGTQREVQP